jgi:ParB/RepB/Spo0J family partition protein
MRTDIIDIKLIDFGERYREDYGEIEELVASIKERGLIQPLAVQAIKNDKYEYLLLAGGRRYVACQLAKISTVPVRIYDTELSEKERLSIELAENIYRKDLEWKEEVKLKRSIHDLMTQEHGPKIAKSPEAPGWSATDTAKLVGSSKSSISRDLKLADAVQSVPKLFETAKTYEMFFIASKGNPTIIKQGRTNTFLFNQVHPTHKIHETERPRDLIKEILETFCLPGSVILSPFLGSGNTILAAKDVGMSAFGYDREKEYKDRFIVRVHKEN